MKKFYIFAGILIACSVSLNVSAQTPPLTQQATSPPRLTQQAKTVTTSEQLVFLAQTENINLLADATFFTSLPHVPSEQEKDDNLIKWLLKIAYEEHLSFRQLNNQTLLLWSEPNVREIAKTLLAENQKSLGQAINRTEGNTPPNILNMMFSDIGNQQAEILLANYLQRTYHWDGQSKNIDVKFKLSDLPQEISDALLKIARKNLEDSISQRQKSWFLNTPWLTEEIWRNAQVGYFQTPSKEVLLAVRGTTGNRDYYVSIDHPKVPFQRSWRPTEIKDLPPLGDNSQADAKLGPKELENDKTLDRLISLEEKEASLSTVLMEMQKRGGVKFTTSPDLLLGKRVTICTSEMPLREVMDALTQLYGITWLRQDNGSYLAINSLTPAQVDSLQIGDAQWFRYWEEPIRRKFAPTTLNLPPLIDLKAEVNKAGIAEEQLSQPNGVKFSTLPVELRDLIRQNIEEQVAVPLLAQYKTVFLDESNLPDDSVDTVTIRISPSTNRVVFGTGTHSVDASPILNAVIVASGKETYTFAIHGQQVRKGIETKLRQYEEMRAKLNLQDKK